MRYINKLFFIIIALVLTFYCCACNYDTKQPTTIIEEDLSSNGILLSDYKIVYSKNAPSSTKAAASELAMYIKRATQITLQITEDDASPASYEIILGKANRKECSDIDYNALGNEGFHLKTVGDKLLIAGDDSLNESRGVIYGVYSFLEKLGYRYYASDVEKIPKSNDVYIPKVINDKQIPVFEFRDAMNGSTIGNENTKWAIKQKINSYFARNITNEYGGSVGFAYKNGVPGLGLVHTIPYFFPASLYLETKPEYFALVNNKRETSQICYSLASIDVVFEEAKLWIASQPNSEYISISQSDNDYFCECGECLNNYQNYGKTGTALNFINKVAEKFSQNSIATKLLFLAYGNTLDVPKGVVPASNVDIQLALLGCQSHGFEDCNHSYKNWQDTLEQGTPLQLLTDWKDAAPDNKMYIWDYSANYFKYLAPNPNFNAIFNNIKTYYKNGVNGVYSEGVGNNKGEFVELRSYLVAKLLWNPEMTEEQYYAHMDDFLQGYYGEGWIYIRQYIDKCLELTKNIHFGNTTNMTFFEGCEDFETNMQFINLANQLWNNAEMYATEAQYKKIRQSRTQITYYELFTTMDIRMAQADQKQREELMTRNKMLYNEIKAFGVGVRLWGNKYLPDSSKVDFNKSPKYW